MSKPGQYDESPELIRKLQDKFKERAIRKANYQKMMSDPYRWAFEAAPVDMGILRFEAQRTFTGSYRFFKPNAYTFTWHFLTIWLPIIGYTIAAKRYRDKQEGIMRRGEIPYKERLQIYM